MSETKGRPRTHTWTEWGVGWPIIPGRGTLWDSASYDDEDDAREHLSIHGPDAFLVSREVTATFWKRAE